MYKIILFTSTLKRNCCYSSLYDIILSHSIILLMEVMFNECIYSRWTEEQHHLSSLHFQNLNFLVITAAAVIDWTV